MASRQLIRSLTTSTSSLAAAGGASAQSVKPPVAVFGIEGRYASALYSAATKKQQLDAVEKDLKTFSGQLKKDKRLQEFLFDPSVKKGLKVQGLAGACDKLQMNSLTKNMLVAMAENGRYSYVNAVVNSFGVLMAAHRGEVVCEVTTAKALDEGMKKEVDGAINSFLKRGQKSLITYKVDPSIIGGMIVSVGDKYADMSMVSKLKKYEDIIKSAA